MPDDICQPRRARERRGPGRRPLVPADPRRRPLSRHARSAPATFARLSAPDRPGRRRARLFRRAAAHRPVLRGFLGRRLGVVPLTRRLRFLVAVRPGLTEPAVAARMAATLDRLSDGRLLINVVTGGDPVELQRRRRLPRPRRALRGHRRIPAIWRGADARARRSTSTASICGSRRASCSIRRCSSPIRRSISAARRTPATSVAAEHVDIYLTWGEPPADVAEKIAARCARAPPRAAARFASASACTSSCARPTTRPGAPRTT